MKALSVAATWDLNLAWKWGESMGAEFFGKGSNVLLGPGLNVARYGRYIDKSVLR
jgi:beta-glucosidase